MTTLGFVQDILFAIQENKKLLGMDRNLVTASTSLVNSIFGQPSPSPSAQHQNQQTTSSLMDRNPGQAARYKKRLEYLNRLEKESFRSEISAKNIIMPSNNQASNAESMLREHVKIQIDTICIN